jgi:mannose-6-phosphate isomerase-like protein (cupin superfamily)
VIESTMAAAAKGPPLHTHAFNETFYVLEGELTFQLGDELTLVGAGGVAFAPRGTPHTLANRSEAPARFLIVYTAAVFEHEFARRAAAFAGTEPQAWGDAADSPNDRRRPPDRRRRDTQGARA